MPTNFSFITFFVLLALGSVVMAIGGETSGGDPIRVTIPTKKGSYNFHFLIPQRDSFNITAGGTNGICLDSVVNSAALFYPGKDCSVLMEWDQNKLYVSKPSKNSKEIPIPQGQSFTIDSNGVMMSSSKESTSGLCQFVPEADESGKFRLKLQVAVGPGNSCEQNLVFPPDYVFVPPSTTTVPASTTTTTDPSSPGGGLEWYWWLLIAIGVITLIALAGAVGYNNRDRICPHSVQA